ncbi:hypothetical protein ACT7DH_13275 [Bacillus pacificus]
MLAVMIAVSEPTTLTGMTDMVKGTPLRGYDEKYNVPWHACFYFLLNAWCPSTSHIYYDDS